MAGTLQGMTRAHKNINLIGAVLGESWHHNHHAFPRAAVHGLRWWEVDITGTIIRTMRTLKLAWNVVEITPERQAQKEQVRQPVAA